MAVNITGLEELPFEPWRLLLSFETLMDEVMLSAVWQCSVIRKYQTETLMDEVMVSAVWQCSVIREYQTESGTREPN